MYIITHRCMYAPFVFCLGGRDFPFYGRWLNLICLNYNILVNLGLRGGVYLHTDGFIQTGNERLEWYCAEITGLSGQFSW